MSNLNPIIEALDGIDESYALNAVARKKKNKPLRIAAIAAAAMLALGGTAAATTLGDDPPIKINDKVVSFKSDTYVDKNGYTIRTRAVETPIAHVAYDPVGTVRAAFFPENASPDQYVLYDELGVNIGEVSHGKYFFFIEIEKEGEIPQHAMRGGGSDLYHTSMSGTPDGEYNIEIWQDPIQIMRQKSAEKQEANMTVEEKAEEFLINGWDIGYPDYGGFRHPSMTELFEADMHGSFGGRDTLKFTSMPGEAMKLYGYAPVSAEGLTEKAGLTVIMGLNGEYDSDTDTWEYPDGKQIDQQIFIYTMTDEESGMDVKFTVWRSAENKDTYTDHFDLDYEYAALADGSTARFHTSENGENIMEYEHGGAAYALVTRMDRDGIERVMKRLGVI